MKRTKKGKPLSAQIKSKVNKPIPKKQELHGNTEVMISTGSTLLDLAISGGRVRGGGIPGGILVEIFGPNSSGKTVLLSSIGAKIQKQGGDVLFHDPEGRFDKEFAKKFYLDTDRMEYHTPDTVTEVFKAVREWEPENEDNINGIMTDSLAALSTNLEMDNEEGDKMGMKRAKEFSEQLRKTCRILTRQNHIMVCSNQIRENLDAGPYGQKTKSPGGKGIGFYASLRLRTFNVRKLKIKKKFKGQEIEEVNAIRTEIEVFKSSVWKPYRKCFVTIDFDYMGGVDDIRENLMFLKKYSTSTTYTLGGEKLAVSLSKAITIVEKEDRETELREEVIDLWEEIQSQFEHKRKPKQP